MPSNTKEIKKKVTVLVCNSNMFIPYALTEILYNQQKEYLVISDIDSIELFFNKIQLSNVDFFKYGTNYKLFDIIKSKRRIMSLTKRYDIEKLIFFHEEFGELVNWFINKISNKTPIFYCKIFPRPLLPKASLKKGIKEKIKQYIYWGINMDILYTGNSIRLVLPTHFFRKNKIQELKIEKSSLLIKTKLASFLEKINIKSSGVLLTGTVVTCKYVDKNDYINQINKIIDQIGANNLVSKCHPRFSYLYGKEKDLKQVPNYIPGNILIENYDFFIGYESTLLVEASKSGKIAISLLELLKPRANELKFNFRQFLDNRLNNEGVIFYPKNITEIISILTDYRILNH